MMKRFRAYKDVEKSPPDDGSASNGCIPALKITYLEDNMEHDLDGAVDNKGDEWASKDKGENQFTQSVESLPQIRRIGPLMDIDKNRRRRRTVLCILLCCLVGGVIGIAIGAIQIKKSSTKSIRVSLSPTGSPTVSLSPTGIPTVSPSPTETPTPAPTRSVRFEEFRRKISNVTDPIVFNQPSPQLDAIDWLVYEDPASLDAKTADESELTERYIAAVVYFSTNGDGWLNKNRFLSEQSICNWKDQDSGISCENGSVTSLFIVDNNVTGVIPPELNSLTNLKTLNLYYNEISGSIPDLGQLSALEQIDLDTNKLSGRVPASLFNLPSLKNLYLLNNPDLKGSIPNITIAGNSSSQLEAISFYNCSLSGSLPKSLGDIMSLRFLQFFQNDMTGTLPSSVTALPNLESLALRGNKLRGTIPPFNGQANLQSISLGENFFLGSLPSGLESLVGLKTLYLNSNNLSGQVPTSISNLPSLEQLWLHENRFEGPVPDLSGNPGTITQAYFNNNLFTGNLDQLFVNAPTSIEWLDLSENMNIFDMQAGSTTIPATVSRLSALQFLNISYYGGLTSTLPTEIGTLSRMHTLSLMGNQLEGTIPTEFGNLERLVSLNVSKNELTGSIPSEFSNLRMLVELNLAENRLENETPSELGALDSLESLWLHGNDVTGNLSAIFCPSNMSTFTADCLGASPELICDCCTNCF